MSSSPAGGAARRAGVMAAQGQAGWLLRRHPIAWLPAVLLHAPLLIAWLGAFAFLVAVLFSPLPEMARGRGLWLAGGLLAGLWVVQAVYEAAWLHLADRLLVDDRAGWGDFVEGALSLSPALLGVRLAWVATRAVLALAGLVLGLLLLTGGDLDRLSQMLGPGGRTLMLEAWLRRGVAWLAAIVGLLAAVVATTNFLKIAAGHWRAALVSEPGPALASVGRAVEFRGQLGCITALGREAVRLVLWAVALWLPWWLAGFGWRQAWPLYDLEPVTGQRAVVVVTVLWLLGTAVTLALASAYLAVGDLVLYRLAGGVRGDATLTTRGSRPRGRVGRRWASAGWALASEAGAQWQPGTLASQPPAAGGASDTGDVRRD